jgi:dethiobiotin synthetase
LSGGLFVTGTDTGVGKTTVARGLARLARRQGLRPIPFKPVETGCAPGPEDARLLWEAAGRPVPLADVCPHALPLPAAPAAAAAAVGLRIDLDDLARRARALEGAGDLLLAEGAGGLLVPYAGSETAADLIARLSLPVLVVARTALGTVNHTALTVRELERRNLPVAGVVMVRGTQEAGPHEAGNADLIEAAAGLRPLGVLPYLSGEELADADCIADRLEAALGTAALRALLRSAVRPG